MRTLAIVTGPAPILANFGLGTSSSSIGCAFSVLALLVSACSSAPNGAGTSGAGGAGTSGAGGAGTSTGGTHTSVGGDGTNTAGSTSAAGAGGSSVGSSPSCTGLAATCGPTGNEDCCASSTVPSGAFYRSYDGMTYMDMGFPATVSDFRLDRFEITVGRFRKFVAAYVEGIIPQGAGANPNNPSDTGWNISWNASLGVDAAALKTALACGDSTWADDPGAPAAESLPINCLSWYDAQAFCTWDGGRLPTEAEWNYAAAAGAEQRAYPWSPDSAFINDSDAVYQSPGVSSVAVVGSKSPLGDGKWGQADLAGNVAEWVQDVYAVPYSMVTCSNCADLTKVGIADRVQRGGSYKAVSLANSYRDHSDALTHASWYGARCARSALAPL